MFATLLPPGSHGYRICYPVAVWSPWLLMHSEDTWCVASLLLLLSFLSAAFFTLFEGRDRETSHPVVQSPNAPNGRWELNLGPRWGAGTKLPQPSLLPPRRAAPAGSWSPAQADPALRRRLDHCPSPPSRSCGQLPRSRSSRLRHWMVQLHRVWVWLSEFALLCICGVSWRLKFRFFIKSGKNQPKSELQGK